MLIYSFNYLTSKISCFCKETYHWSLRKMGLSMEGFWRGIWNWEDGFWKRGLKKRKRKRRKEIGEFSFLETNLGLGGWYIYIGERMEEKGFRGFFAEKHSGSRKRAIATKVVWVRFSMFLKLITYAWFLHVFHFWIFNVLLIGVDAKGHKFFLVDIGCWCVRLKPVCDPRH